LTLDNVGVNVDGMKVLVLRTCDEKLQAYGGFQWPENGFVEAPDWDPKPECGNGLHGFLWGEGDGSLADWSEKAKWLVCEVDDDQIIGLQGKVKFKNCKVVFCGNREGATTYILANGSLGKAVIGATLTGGDGATLTGGDRATLTGGDRATLTGGDGATLTGGYRATLTGGDRATLTGGNGATLTGGDRATLTGGDGATLTGGDRATLTGGDGATLTGGENSVLMFSVWDGKRKRVITTHTGEDGILERKTYRLIEGKVSELS
jgi:hypothetical protein